MCVLSSLSFLLTVAQQPAVLFPVVSTLHKQEADLSLSLRLFPFICPFLSVPWSLFLPLPTLPPPIRTSLLLEAKQTVVTFFIQDKCDIVPCPGRLNCLLLTYFLLVLFLAFLFFHPGLPLESCQKC